MNRCLRTAAALALTLPMWGASARAGAAAGSTGGGLSPVASTVVSAMDKTADPCADFYRYACGGWLDSTKLPADQSRWGRGFTEIAERNRAALRTILEESANKPGDDPARKKLGDYYRACMDEAKADSLGAKPIESLLKDAGSIQNPKSLMQVTGKLTPYVQILFSGRVTPDFKNPEKDIAYFSQGGLGLPDRDYYLKDDDKSKQTRADYQAHMAKMFQLLGENEADAKKHTEQVVGFETELAKVSRPRVDMRDPEKTYNKLDITGLKALTPGLDWDAFLAATGYPNTKDINVAVPEFFQGVNKLAASTPKETLQAYARWSVLRSAAQLLSKPFVDENFAFYGQKLAGQKEIKPRWKRCVESTDDALGELLGQEFIETSFPGDSKTIAVDLVHRIEDSFEGNLKSLSWMDDTTRGRANTKKTALNNKVGYPDVWRDYSKLMVKPGDFVGNALAARKFDFEFEANKIGKPVDKKEWGMTPPTVNAYYNPLYNEMVFPAGILQPPFFDRSFPMAMNFGGIGMVMGHELTHGFDDQGRKFDPTGKLSEWWEPAVSASFEQRAKCVSDLYSTYEVQPGLKLNGKLTLGENIADLGGIKQAYGAYKRWAAQNPDKDKAGVPGLSNDQLFFVGFAQTWCSIQTPEIERMLVTVNPHSHPHYRVVGPLSNFPEFARAFQCGEGTPMHPKDVCEVW